VVQANISNSDKEWNVYGRDTRSFIMNKFFALTDQALAKESTKPTFVMWPETAYPDTFFDPHLTTGLTARLKEFVLQHQTPILTGGYALVDQRPSNALMVVSQKGELETTPYSKTHLLAFGEYLPGSTWFPIIKTWIPEVADFARGHGPQILNLDNMKLGGQICYEGLFDGFSRGLGQLGSQMIVNVTNDSWYPDWNEPFQHLYMTLARAVETRRPLIRSTNTGISTAILANGDVLTLSPRGQEWTHVFDIPYLENPLVPPFLTWGYYLFPVILGVAFILLVIWRKKTWQKP
jgi:apolipoprotein N-acyltransferase